MISLISRGIGSFKKDNKKAIQCPPFLKQKLFLPEQAAELKGKPTLVLDLDQTLVDSSLEKSQLRHDFYVDVEYENQLSRVYIFKRPFLQDFLQSMFECYELVIFTAADKIYADRVVNKIDPNGLISHRLYKESCINQNMKDLSRLGRDLKSTIIIDDNPSCYMLHPANGLPIGRFYFQNKVYDQELKNLIPVLKKAAKCSDVTVAVKKWKKMARLQAS